MSGLVGLIETALRELRDNPGGAIFFVFIVATCLSSLYVAVRLIRLVAFEDYREEIALRLADPATAERLPRIYQFRLRGVLPADRPGEWQRLEDLSHWVRNEALKRLAGVAVGIPITALMISSFMNSDPPAADESAENAAKTWAKVTATANARAACTSQEIERFIQLRDDPARDARTPIAFVCQSGHTIRDR